MRILMLVAVAYISGVFPSLAQDIRNAPRPIEAVDTVWLEGMTSMEVRDSIAAGTTTAIVMTGGMDENGPYIVTGQHNYNTRNDAEIIARKLGNALVAPIISFSPTPRPPENDDQIFPGPISLRTEVFKEVLVDVCGSLKQHGFRDIILMGDHGSNGPPMQEVADMLNARWGNHPAKVHHVNDYRAQHVVIDEQLLPHLGVHEVPEGIHDSYRVTAILSTINPELLRYTQRVDANRASINGVSIVPLEKTIDTGKKIIELKTNNVVDAIRELVENRTNEN